MGLPQHRLRLVRRGAVVGVAGSRLTVPHFEERVQNLVNVRTAGSN
jgi:ribose 1,5-bisphosphokinase PhnN